MKNRYTNPDFFVLTDGCSVVTWGSHKLLTHLTEAQDKANKLTYLRLNFSLTVSRLRNRKDIKGEKEEKRLQVSDFRCLTSLQYGNHEATNVEKMSEVVKTKCIWVWQQQHSKSLSGGFTRAQRQTTLSCSLGSSGSRRTVNTARQTRKIQEETKSAWKTKWYSVPNFPHTITDHLWTLL